MTTSIELAQKLNGLIYPLDRHPNYEGIIIQAKQSDLVIVYGSSDDLMEFDGAIKEEIASYEGTTVKLCSDGILPSLRGILENYDFDFGEVETKLENELKNYFQHKDSSKPIKAIWHDEGNPCWTYETQITHEKFQIMEDGEIYCIGIVFNLSDI